MSPDPKRPAELQVNAQKRFLSLLLRSEREVFRYVAALVSNVADAEDIVQQTALALWEKFDAYDPSQPLTPCRELGTRYGWKMLLLLGYRTNTTK